MQSDIRREIVLAMRHAVRAPIAFCFAASADGEDHYSGLQSVDGTFTELPTQCLKTLADEFRFHTAFSSTHYCVSISGLPEPTSFFGAASGNSLVPPNGNVLFLYLRLGNSLFGIAGLARRNEDGRFDDADRERLEHIGPLLSSLTMLHTHILHLQRRQALVRAIPNFSGVYAVVNVLERKVVYTCESHEDAASSLDIRPHELRLVQAAERALEERRDCGTISYYPTFNFAKIIRVADLGDQTLFGTGQCVAFALQPPALATSATLSEREQQVARLLADGYSCVNTAAVLNLSENTVRTYVRRLYRKLEVTNRVDLVQRLSSTVAAAG